MKKRLLRQQRDEALALAAAFREELTRISHLLQMPGSPDLGRDVAPAVDDTLALLNSSNAQLRGVQLEASGLRHEAHRLLIALENANAKLTELVQP